MINRKSGLFAASLALCLGLIGCQSNPSHTPVNLDKSHVPPSAMKYLNAMPPQQRAQVERQLQQQQGGAGAPAPTSNAPAPDGGSK